MLPPAVRTLVFLITGLGVGGGAEQQVRSLALSMRKRGWAVAIISMLPVERRYEELDAAGVEVHSLMMTRGVPDPRALVRLRGLLRRMKPDVLHSHMVHANLLARLARLLVAVPVVVSTMHNQDEGAQWRYLAYRLTDRLADLTTTVSRIAADEAVRRGAVRRGRIVVVPNGLRTLDYREDPAAREACRRSLGIGAEFVWLAVGRLTAAKDYPNMIEAFEQLLGVNPDQVLLIAGTGPQDDEVAALVGASDHKDRIRLLGLRTDVATLLQAADAFVMSSAWEGLPLALLEASASGLPIVATNVGGSSDAVVDGETGYIAERRDPAALAAAMEQVAMMPAVNRRRMGTAARDHMERVFELEGIADRWGRLYAECLERASNK